MQVKISNIYWKEELEFRIMGANPNLEIICTEIIVNTVRVNELLKVDYVKREEEKTVVWILISI